MGKRTQLLYISSASRVSGTPSDFVVRIPHGLLKVQKLGKITVIPVEATLNRSWYSVRSDNNSFSIFDGLSMIPYSLTPGYYNVTQIRAVLTALLPAWTITYSTSQNKFTLRPPLDGKTYSLSFQDYASELLGFPLGAMPAGTNASPIVSSIPCKVSRENAVLIHSNLPKAKMSVSDNVNGTLVESDVLLKIPIQAELFANIVFTNSSADLHDIELSVQHVDSIRFWVADQDMRPLDLPYDWSLTLRLVFSEGPHDVQALLDNVSRIQDHLKLMLLSSDPAK